MLHAVRHLIEVTTEGTVERCDTREAATDAEDSQ